MAELLFEDELSNINNIYVPVSTLSSLIDSIYDKHYKSDESYNNSGHHNSYCTNIMRKWLNDSGYFLIRDSGSIIVSDGVTNLVRLSIEQVGDKYKFKETELGSILIEPCFGVQYGLPIVKGSYLYCDDTIKREVFKIENNYIHLVRARGSDSSIDTKYIRNSNGIEEFFSYTRDTAYLKIAESLEKKAKMYRGRLDG